MAIEPTQIITIPATEAKVADRYWLKSLSIEAPSLTKPVTVVAKLTPYNSVTGEMFHIKTITLRLDDVLTLASSQPALANCVETIFTEIDRQAKLQNLI